MVQIKIGAGALHLFLCFLVLLPSTTMTANTINGQATGLTLELIHHDSERSPYYSANLTEDERHERLHKLSDSRLQWFKSSSLEQVNLTTIRPPVQRVASTVYIVVLKIGTGQGSTKQFLQLDTASALTWTQCKPCDPCFTQEPPYYEPRHSLTYRQMPSSDPLCKIGQTYSSVNNVCNYRVRYADSSYTMGKFSRETFGFQAIPGQVLNTKYIAKLAFGCSHASVMQAHSKFSAGILGMNADPESFAVQLGHGVFSYCFAPKSSRGNSGYLRFGDDIRMGERVQQTPLEIPEGNGNYYLTLLGISVGDQRLNLDPRLFRRRTVDNDGVIIDSGSSTTHLVKPAFMAAEAALKAYFERYNLRPVREDMGTCFPLSRSVERLFPSLTFHFQGADLEVEGVHMFWLPSSGNIFCWEMDAGNGMTIIGAAQQINKRFIYDLRRRMLSFAPENCAQDA